QAARGAVRESQVLRHGESRDRPDRRQCAVVQALPQGRHLGGGSMIGLRGARVIVALALAALFGAGCHEKQQLTAPPPPLRPEADPAPPKPQATAQKDCEPTNPDRELKPLSFDERSIPEGNRLAEQGRAKLRTAQSAEVTKLTREDMVTQAV